MRFGPSLGFVLASVLALGTPGQAAGPQRFAARPDPETDRHLDQPPLGSRVVDFDDGNGTCTFGETTALRLDYVSLGVTFAGNGPLNGGAIVHECIGENVTGQSSPNYLAFSWNGVLADGGVPLLPETLTFDPPVSHVQLNAASPTSASMVITAYDRNNFWVGEAFAAIGPTMT
ncbi:MAG TPA: hypothetical protein VFO11_00790, partial [Candidatus Polarisedimenticolaceae bacterium]|nr:hypothetical protein [Candidatus Polarisedimenticolaceae bacterium]